MKGWAPWALHHRGQQSQQWDHNPWGAIPASQVLQEGKWWSEGTRAAGVAGKVVPRGGMVSVSPEAVASPGTAGLSVAETPPGPRREQLPVLQDAEPECKSCWGWSSSGRGSTGNTSLLGHAGPGSPDWFPRACQAPDLATGLLQATTTGYSAPGAVQLSIPLSSIWAFGEQKQDRRQICAKGDGSTFSSRSLGVPNLGERLNWFKMQYAAVWKCIVCMCTFIYKDQRKVLCYVV